MKLKVLKYNKKKAIWWFVLLKFLEVFGLFLFFFGFNSLGNFVYDKFGDYMNFGIPTTYFDFWSYGFFDLLIGIFILGILFLIGCLIYYWLKGNWFWAKTIAEDKESKKERLEEQKKLKEIERIEELEKQRDKWGYCVGDYVKDGNSKIIEKINFVYDDGNIDWGEYKNVAINQNDKIIKKVNLKKPKLSELRQKEINEKK